MDNILTTSGSQQVSGTVIMNTLRAHTITLPDGGTVGGVDLSEELVLLDGDATLGNGVEFILVKISGNDMFIELCRDNVRNVA